MRVWRQCFRSYGAERVLRPMRGAQLQGRGLYGSRGCVGRDRGGVARVCLQRGTQSHAARVGDQSIAFPSHLVLPEARFAWALQQRVVVERAEAVWQVTRQHPHLIHKLSNDVTRVVRALLEACHGAVDGDAYNDVDTLMIHIHRLVVVLRELPSSSKPHLDATLSCNVLRLLIQWNQYRCVAALLHNNALHWTCDVATEAVSFLRKSPLSRFLNPQIVLTNIRNRALESMTSDAATTTTTTTEPHQNRRRRRGHRNQHHDAAQRSRDTQVQFPTNEWLPLYNDILLWHVTHFGNAWSAHAWRQHTFNQLIDHGVQPNGTTYDVMILGSHDAHEVQRRLSQLQQHTFYNVTATSMAHAIQAVGCTSDDVVGAERLYEDAVRIGLAGPKLHESLLRVYAHHGTCEAKARAIIQQWEHVTQECASPFAYACLVQTFDDEHGAGKAEQLLMQLMDDPLKRSLGSNVDRSIWNALMVRFTRNLSHAGQRAVVHAMRVHPLSPRWTATDIARIMENIFPHCSVSETRSAWASIGEVFPLHEEVELCTFVLAQAAAFHESNSYEWWNAFVAKAVHNTCNTSTAIASISTSTSPTSTRTNESPLHEHDGEAHVGHVGFDDVDSSGNVIGHSGVHVDTQHIQSVLDEIVCCTKWQSMAHLTRWNANIRSLLPISMTLHHLLCQYRAHARLGNKYAAVWYRRIVRRLRDSDAGESSNGTHDEQYAHLSKYWNVFVQLVTWHSSEESLVQRLLSFMRSKHIPPYAKTRLLIVAKFGETPIQTLFHDDWWIQRHAVVVTHGAIVARALLNRNRFHEVLMVYQEVKRSCGGVDAMVPWAIRKEAIRALALMGDSDVCGKVEGMMCPLGWRTEAVEREVRSLQHVHVVHGLMRECVIMANDFPFSY